MKAFLYALFFLPAAAVYSQKVVDVGKENLPVTSGLFYSVGGEPVSNYKYVMVVEGSPYFNESWMRGKVVMSGGFVYDSVFLRIDMADNTLHYLNPDRQEMIATSPIQAVILSDSVKGKKYHFIYSSYLQSSGMIEPGWYQLLDTGQAALYKRFIKTINENKPYGSATIEQKIATASNYFLMVNSVFTQVKKIKEIPEMLQHKKEELRSYINSKNLSGRSEADYVALTSYYNSLVVK